MTEKEAELLEQARRVLQIEANAIHSLVDRIDDGLIKAINILYASAGKVVVTGMGKSGLIGKKIAATLASTGTPALFLHPAEGGHGDIGMVAKGDAVIAISNSGETDEIIRILPVLERLGIKLIALTGNLKSTLSKAADVVLDVSVQEEACPMGLVPTASTTAVLAMGDALAIALLSKREFKEADFAFFHPGGNLGRRLLLTTGELIHAGSLVPSVHLNTCMKDAIIEISSKRLGMTTVVNDDAQLEGVITDGDLRRGLEKWGEKFLAHRAEDVMTQRPKTVTRDTLSWKIIPLPLSLSLLLMVRQKGLSISMIF
jgi:arabinose-5-phosphate isomerase